jgi:hypothetical protein
MHPEQKRIYRSMTAADKLRAVTRLYHAARRLKAAALRSAHPDWTEEQIEKEVKRIFMDTR